MIVQLLTKLLHATYEAVLHLTSSLNNYGEDWSCYLTGVHTLAMSKLCNIRLILWLWKKKITSGRCLNKSSAEKNSIVRQVGFSHFSKGTTWKQLNYYVNAVIIPIFLVYMSHTKCTERSPGELCCGTASLQLWSCLLNLPFQSAATLSCHKPSCQEQTGHTWRQRSTMGIHCASGWGYSLL